MVLFVGPENFTKELASCFHALVTDRKSIVRRTISCGFHEVLHNFPSSAFLIEETCNVLLVVNDGIQGQKIPQLISSNQNQLNVKVRSRIVFAMINNELLSARVTFKIS